MLYKTCYRGFFKRFLMRTPESAFESFKNLKRFVSHFLFFSEVKALDMFRGFAIFDCK